MKIVWLKGDYVGREHRERQKQAADKGCAVVVEFHFNSAGSPLASGGEIYYSGRRDGARELANGMVRAFLNAGIRVRRPAVIDVDRASSASRAGYIAVYHCPTVLLEPLFITNVKDARWIHDEDNVRVLGAEVGAAIEQFYKAHKLTGPVGISVGHLFKSSAPNDRGAKCVLGDMEADHAMKVALATERFLTSKR